MKFVFNNKIPSGISEISTNPYWLASGSNWSTGSPRWLVFWIYGNIANPANEKLYVKLNKADTIVIPDFYIVPGSEIAAPWWTQVAVPLNPEELDLSSISNLTIGLAGEGIFDESGFFCIDDIRLYNTLPAVAEPVNPGNANLVALYKMQNNTDDSSGKGLNGTATGTAFVNSCYAAYGKALAFDANNDYVDLGSAEPFNFTDSFSISFWVKIEAWSTDWSHVMAATRGEGMGFSIRKGSYWTGMFQGVDGGGMAFTTRGIGLATGFGNSEDMMAAAPKLNTWTHVVCVFDKANNVKRVYHNSKLVREAAVLAGKSLTPSTANASLGGRAKADGTGFENLFKGALDDVRFYNKALSAGEVRFLADPTP